MWWLFVAGAHPLLSFADQAAAEAAASAAGTKVLDWSVLEATPFDRLPE